MCLNCRWPLQRVTPTSPRASLPPPVATSKRSRRRSIRTASSSLRSSLPERHAPLTGGSPEAPVGDVVFLRPEVWHGYECDYLELYNCGFTAEMLYRELAWTHEDPVLGYLLWSAPLSAGDAACSRLIWTRTHSASAW